MIFLSLLFVAHSGGQEARHMEFRVCQDTTLEQAAPGSNFGREPGLFGGAGRVILIRFPEVIADRPVRISRASLHLTRQTAGELHLRSVGLLKKVWYEGGGRSINFSHPGAPEPETTVGSATWTAARWKTQSWALPGASGPEDVELIPDATLSVNGANVVIEGLGAAVSRLQSDPTQNFGLRLEFEENSVFGSSEVKGAEPTLDVEFQELPASAIDVGVTSCEAMLPPGARPGGEPVIWRATVQNDGEKAVKDLELVWSLDGVEIGRTRSTSALAAGTAQAQEMQVPWKYDGANHREQRLVVRAVASGDTDPGNDSLAVNMSALPVFMTGKEARANINQMNEIEFPLSRGSSSLDGCLERIRLVTDQSRAEVVVKPGESLPEALLGLPASFSAPPLAQPAFPAGLDVRDDSTRPSTRALPSLGWPLRDIETTPLPVGYLSRTLVNALNASVGQTGSARLAWMHKLPLSSVIWCLDSQGAPLKGAHVAMFQSPGTEAVAEGTTNNGGGFFFAKRPGGPFPPNPFGVISADGSNSWMLVKVTAGGATEEAWFPLWSLWDEAARGNLSAPLFEFRFMLAADLLDRTKDIAEQRIVTDSVGHLPAELDALVDGNPKTSVDFLADTKDSWIEIDLGRDRQIGEVQIEIEGDSFFDGLTILRYGTSQSVAAAVPWFVEKHSGWHVAYHALLVDGRRTLIYRASAEPIRFLRLIPSDGHAKIAAIRVYAKPGT